MGGVVQLFWGEGWGIAELGHHPLFGFLWLAQDCHLWVGHSDANILMRI